MSAVFKSRADRQHSLTSALRSPRGHNSDVALPFADKQSIMDVAAHAMNHLKRNYSPAFGLFPSAEAGDNYYAQVFTRDFAHASGNYFAYVRPSAVADCLRTIFVHQKPSGMLPFRVEREYGLLKLIPGVRLFDSFIFDCIERRLKGRKERPVYEGQDFSGSEDTIPAAIIAAGELFIGSAEGREFVNRHFEQMKKAIEFFRTKTDPSDGLAVITTYNADWADSLKRTGKLGAVNVWWARALRLMAYMSAALRRTPEEAEQYRAEFRNVKRSVMTKLYNGSEGYFRAKEAEDRLDTV